MSSNATISSSRPAALMDERDGRWAPASLSDQQLLELESRLGRLRRLGGAFADLTFSAQVKDRLRELHARVGRSTTRT